MKNVRIIGSPLYQWEVGRQLEILPVSGFTINAVHVSNLGDTESLVVKPRLENGVLLVDIPNVLLQNGKSITVFTVTASEESVETVRDYIFTVCPRPKPSDYVYTETEVQNYSSLDKRLTDLEGDGIANAVATYLAENPVEVGATAEQAAQIEQNKTDIEKLSTDKLDASKLPEAVNDALAQAKESGEFKGEPGEPGEPGQPGYTPQKGIDYFDGAPGADYQLTVADKTEIAEMAAELVEVPEATMKPLTFTGAVNATYDGSEAVEVEIPQGGGGENWEYIGEFNVGEEDVEEWIITEDENGKPIELRKMYASITLEPSEATTGNTALLLGNPGYKTPFATNFAIVSLAAAIRTSRNTTGGTFYYCPNGDKSEVICRYSTATYNVTWSRGRVNKAEEIIKPCLAGIAMKTANASTGLIGAGSTIKIWGVRV